ncbi:hypothetical protein [uncultured Roseibium sp.]|uniref:hypothetical protein n=1 Tax=uncultured Roseibium sp. TaxID=1936171 RepID=UPI00260662E6|nr:hypothetical protein [uncultured Roseibium sp.]
MRLALFLKILAGVACVVVLVVAVVFYLTSGITKVGDDFFAAVASGDIDEAYGYLAKDFQAGTDMSQLVAFLASTNMDDASETSWSNRSVTVSTGTLVGTLTSNDGRRIPIEVDLVKENGQWKIYAIHTEASGPSETAGDLPSEGQQVALVNASIAAFVDSAVAKDMTGFHDHISRLWAGQFSVAQLDEAYASIFTLGPGVQTLKQLAPVFSEPASLSGEGVMEIKGYYPTQPDRFWFGVKYVYEGTGWKLLGFSFDIK